MSAKPETLTYTASPEDRGIRLDMFLTTHNPQLTRSQIKKLIASDNVAVNDLHPKAGIKLKAGDRIALTILPPEPMAALPEPMPLDILFEDEALIVLNKPPGLVVHPAAGNYTGTLVNGLLYHCQSFSTQGGPFRPGIVHRLDKNTSGVMVAAKNEHAHNLLAAQFLHHTVTRRYLALTVGTMQEPKGTVSSLIGRSARDRKKMSSRPIRGKHAVTHWEVLKRYRFFTLLAITLETGRTHQIRVHLASIHRPVLGDPEYGGRAFVDFIPNAVFRHYLSLMKRQALHATTLGFIHPVGGKYVEFSAPPPDDFRAVIRALEEID